jgi:protein ImuB
MLWLALHLPVLPLEAFCASLPPAAPGAAERPVVLVDQHRVHSVNRAAAERGIGPGIRRATALALAADLLVADRDPAREAAALQAVVHAALVFTPSVCLHERPPDDHHQGPTVLLEVQASLRLFGGLPQLRQQLLQALAPLGHRVQLAAAPTALGAALLAQWARPAAAEKSSPRGASGRCAPDLQALQALLGRAPVALLGACRAHADVLRATGLHTVAELQALPRDGVSRRFGPAVLDELDRALGQQEDPRRWLTPAPVFESRLELYARAESTDQVLHGAAVLLARLVAWAQARQGRVGGFTLRMLHERQRSTDRGETPVATDLQVPLAEPALDPAHLQLLLRERLAHCALAAPTLELQLLCRHLVAAPAPNGELFPTSSSRAEGLVRLLERLCARLGPEQVHRVLPVADFRPERSRVTVPAQGPLPAVPAAAAAAAAAAVAARSPHGPPPLPLHRPVWLLPEPLPLAEHEALPWLQGRALQLVSGPERIETGWWDAAMVARDYFIGMAEDGCLVWVFRDRVPAASGEVHWYLQGRFG